MQLKQFSKRKAAKTEYIIYLLISVAYFVLIFVIPQFLQFLTELQYINSNVGEVEDKFVAINLTSLKDFLFLPFKNGLIRFFVAAALFGYCLELTVKKYKAYKSYG